MRPIAIGIDVGGTKIAGALVETDGTVSNAAAVPSPRSVDGADPGAAATRSLIDGLMIVAAAEGRTMSAIGIGVPEYVTPAGEIASTEVLAWGADDLNVLGSTASSSCRSGPVCPIPCALMVDLSPDIGARRLP